MLLFVRRVQILSLITTSELDILDNLTPEVRRLTPPFGLYTALSAQLSGSLRHTHSRMSEFAEEIAFFGGEETEKLLVEREYAGLVMHENRVLRRRWWHGCVEEGIVKWLWGSFGVSKAGVRADDELLIIQG